MPGGFVAFGGGLRKHAEYQVHQEIASRLGPETIAQVEHRVAASIRFAKTEYLLEECPGARNRAIRGCLPKPAKSNAFLWISHFAPAAIF
jgi:hypothetical protein